MYGKNLDNVTRFDIKENYDDCNYLYGGEDYIITGHDLIALANGKILNTDINMEYGFTIKLADGAIEALIKYIDNWNAGGI